MTSKSITGPPRWFGGLLLLAATVIACLTVLTINRGPLVYFDTGSYFRQGNIALSMILPAPAPQDGIAAQSPGAAAGKDDDETAGGSRSIVYALLVAAFWRVDALGGVAVVQLALLMLAVWLAMRLLERSAPTGRTPIVLITLPLLAAATTSLPFYVAYIMPDIFTSVMLILIAAVVASGRQIQIGEVLAIFALGLFAVVLHPSHLGIAVLMFPLTVLAAVLRIGQGRWLAVGFMIFLSGLAMAERKVFEVAVETATQKEVVYTPHITARLIVDGPGMAYLDDVCPSSELATCALHEALSWSDDPYRLTASHIIFERSENLGSFRLMTAEDQQAVAFEQRDFFLRVLAARPIGTVLALAGNATEQLLTNSVVMTIPNEVVVSNVKSLSGLPEGQFDVLDDTVLTADQGWIGPLDTVHAVIYLISAVIVVGLIIWPGQVATAFRVFALFLLLGIAVNALVCGGVSQPAPRYGARVMWLLPFAATLLLLVRRPKALRSVSAEDP